MPLCSWRDIWYLNPSVLDSTLDPVRGVPYMRHSVHHSMLVSVTRFRKKRGGGSVSKNGTRLAAHCVSAPPHLSPPPVLLLSLLAGRPWPPFSCKWVRASRGASTSRTLHVCFKFKILLGFWETYSIPSALHADRSSAKFPHALGEDIDVPFINCECASVQFGTHVMAPPGAIM